jgi:hypothetical protein
MLRRIFDLKTDEVTEEWRKLHNEDFNDACSSPNIVWVIKLRRMIWVRYVARMRRDMYRVLVGKPEGKNQWEDPGVNGRIMLRWIFKKWNVGVWTGFSWLKVETCGGH